MTLRKTVLYIALLSLFSLLLVPEAHSYLLTARAVSQGSSAGAATSYRLRGIVRAHYVRQIGGTIINLGEGFLRSAYFSSQVILAPIVTSMVPASGLNSGPIVITNLGGANYQAGATVRLSKSGQTDINATAVTVVNTGRITCTLDLTGAAGGPWNVTVTNPDGRSGTLPAAFTIAYPAPTVTAIVPRNGTNDQTAFNVKVSGTAFRPGATVALSKAGEADLIGTAVVFVSATALSARFDLAGRSTGIWDVKVANDDGQSGLLAPGFKLEALVAAITSPIEFTVIPNPQFPSIKSTGIKYNLNKDADIVIDIYSMRGEKIWSWTAPAGLAGAQVGPNEVIWDGITAFKSVAGAGVYLIHISARTPQGTKLLSKQKLGIIK